MKLSEYWHRNFHFLGNSEGGTHTCIALPQYRLLFDTGIGSSKLTDYPLILLSHGHLDHASGLAYLISQRSLRHLSPPEIYAPPEIVEPLTKIMKLWGEIEDYHSQYKLTAVDYSQNYHLKGNQFFRAIRSVHRVPSNGYAIVEKTQKLKAEYLELTGKEIARRKHAGEDLFNEVYQPIVTFSGDTQIEFVTENELVRKSRILFLECTYICDKRPIQRARDWGHIHLDEIVNNAEAFRDIEKLYLIHFSPRYGRREVEETLRRKLPDWLHERTTPFLTIQSG
jgi:ribonuclease Z